MSNDSCTYMKEVSSLIVNTEAIMQQWCFVPTTFKKLEWNVLNNDGIYRILYYKKPLCEWPFNIQEKCYQELPNLFSQALTASQVTQHQLNTYSTVNSEIQAIISKIIPQN